MQIPDSLNKFSVPIRIVPADIDLMNHVNNVVYLRWVQDVATAHWNATASPELKSKYAWVVLRHEIDYLAPALPGDELIGYTWVGEISGPRFPRFVDICNSKTAKTLAKATTTWCLLDAQTFRPKRIESDILEILGRYQS